MSQATNRNLTQTKEPSTPKLQDCSKETENGFGVRMDLYINKQFSRFVETEVLPGLDIPKDEFWENLSLLVKRFGPKNRALLAKRRTLQEAIDQWHKRNTFELTKYKLFLKKIGYIESTTNQLHINNLDSQSNNVSMHTENVDTEITQQAGPQLVVPIKNARFAINAANARWGSLYDALYGTDALTPPTQTKSKYDNLRGQIVIDHAKNLLDETFPITTNYLDDNSTKAFSANHQKEPTSISHSSATHYFIKNQRVHIHVKDMSTVALPKFMFRGYTGSPENPTTILLIHNNLHVELQFDRQHPIGKNDPAGIKDIVLESAITTIQDMEDSVVAVDAEDKIEVYRNLLQLCQGRLTTVVSKDDRIFTRMLNTPRSYLDQNGKAFSLPGTSLQLIRNVGHLMTSTAVLDEACCEIPEGILDAWITTVCGLYDINKLATDPTKNSQENSIYVVKPKMHGSEEVKFTVDLFSMIEKLLKIKPNTIKLGIMDEERRTSLNLEACIAAAKHRVIFINTGFLDRTGDEIHTSMEAGPVVRKNAMRQEDWMLQYEASNVETGLRCGFRNKAQIGKGMWAKPEEMSEMLEQKIGHVLSGANCAWVPSPTAATLHVMHYHKISVKLQQDTMEATISNQRESYNNTLNKLLTIPLLKNENGLSQEDIQYELDNNAQSILGYVVRWIDQGIGCSKVADIHGTYLMEDRATLRISSQHMGNWLKHGLCTKNQIKKTFLRMAKVVDEQNKDDREYLAILKNPEENLALKVSIELVMLACDQPNGYTEPLLHHYRMLAKRGGK